MATWFDDNPGQTKVWQFLLDRATGCGRLVRWLPCGAEQGVAEGRRHQLIDLGPLHLRGRRFFDLRRRAHYGRLVVIGGGQLKKQQGAKDRAPAEGKRPNPIDHSPIRLTFRPLTIVSIIMSITTRTMHVVSPSSTLPAGAK